MTSPAIPSPKGEMPLADIDLDALITTWERNPHMLGFRDAVLSCLRELKARRSSSSREEVRREALEEAAEGNRGQAHEQRRHGSPDGRE